MQNFPEPFPPEIYIRHMFSSKAAKDGGVIRRKVRDIERILGRSLFEHEIKRRGYHAIENGGQFIIFCNNQAVKVIC